MASQKIEINTNILNGDIQEIQSCVQNIKNNLKNMFDEVNEMNTMWKGQANQAYNTQFATDYETMSEIIKELEEYVTSMKDAKKAYDRCEGSVEDIVRSIRI